MNLGQFRRMTEAFDDETEILVEAIPENVFGFARRKPCEALFTFGVSTTIVVRIAR